jgi:hypothetical protein
MSFPGGKAHPGSDADHPPHLVPEVKNKELYLLYPCTFTCCATALTFFSITSIGREYTDTKKRGIVGIWRESECSGHHFHYLSRYVIHLCHRSIVLLSLSLSLSVRCNILYESTIIELNQVQAIYVHSCAHAQCNDKPRSTIKHTNGWERRDWKWSRSDTVQEAGNKCKPEAPFQNKTVYIAPLQIESVHQRGECSLVFFHTVHAFYIYCLFPYFFFVNPLKPKLV